MYNAGYGTGYTNGKNDVSLHVQSGSGGDDSIAYAPAGLTLWTSLFIIPTRNTGDNWSWNDVIKNAAYNPSTGEINGHVHNFNWFAVTLNR